MENRGDSIAILKLITDMRLKKEEILTLEGTSPDVEYLLTKSLDLGKSKRFEDCAQTLQAVLDVTWEELNTGHWSQVPDCQRVIYSSASLLKVVALVERAIQSADGTSTSLLEQAVRAADMGLLLGSSHREQLTRAAHLLSEAIAQSLPKMSHEGEPVCDDQTPELQVSAINVPHLHCPSLETFSAQHFYPRKPVKITGCMSHWPALRRWGDLDYLLAVAGTRTVPVELGSSYAEADWSQKLMTLRDFITRCITHPDPGANCKGYLAQHQLFDQVPELRKDIVIPEYCACSDADDDGGGEGDGEVDINAWFGPAGTVSPLHHDPKHNLLCQLQ